MKTMKTVKVEILVFDDKQYLSLDKLIFWFKNFETNTSKEKRFLHELIKKVIRLKNKTPNQ